jgi:hypothetical protein
VQTPSESSVAYAFLLCTQRALFLFKRGPSCGRLGEWKTGEACKEVTDMPSLEIIGVMGTLFGFLVYAMVRTQVAKRDARAEGRADERTARPAEETR